MDIKRREHHIDLQFIMKMGELLHVCCIISRTLNSKLWEIIIFLCFWPKHLLNQSQKRLTMIHTFIHVYQGNLASGCPVLCRMINKPGLTTLSTALP